MMNNMLAMAGGASQLKDHTGEDSTTHDETNHSVAGKKKDEVVEGEEHVEEADDDSGAEADDHGDQPDEVFYPSVHYI